MEAAMNEIKIRWLLLAAVITLVVFIAAELLVENFFERIVFRDGVTNFYLRLGVQRWNWMNNLINFIIALVNTTMMMWLYASIRPMFGVGIKTVLIASLFSLIFATAFSFNVANLTGGYYPWKVALLESLYSSIELPVAMIAGAAFYERGY